MEEIQVEKLLRTAIRAAQNAGREILRIYENPARWEIRQKADASPLTLADRRAHECILQELQNTPASFPVLSEESSSPEENARFAYENRKELPFFWLVDPLDGTKEFIKRNGEFTVNIALIQDRRAILGVVYLPVNGKTYWAAKGSGAWRQSPTGKKQRLEAALFQPEQKPVRVICSRSHLNEETQAFIAQFSELEKISAGSSLKFLLIAEGKAEIYPRLAPTMEWDTAAAQIILEEAGGSVLAWETQRPLQYNKASLRNPFFIAYGRRQKTGAESNRQITR